MISANHKTLEKGENMGLNNTPSSERIHIGFFGCRNAGKSSLVNAITDQELSVVSEIKGTTTDPVYKSMELLPLGPVVIIDTPGMDDNGFLGEKRVKKTRQILNKTDCAVLVMDSTLGKTEAEEEMITLFKERNIPYILVYNKWDTVSQGEEPSDGIAVSATNRWQIELLKERIGGLIKKEENGRRIVGDLIKPYDLVVLVIPIDESAPKGRLILPQQQTIRDILEAGGITVTVRDTELEETLSRLGQKPALVITDSQAFKQVSRVTPLDVKLTSFSILMARYKGFLETAVKGVAAIDQLQDGDRVLIAEGCTHHRQCNDIGTVKIPGWLKQYTGKELIIETSSGRDFPEDLSPYSLIIHCGGCMLNEKEVEYRRKSAIDAEVPFTNYGITIAYMQGILKRSLEILPQLEAVIKK
jgi:[FeFe] hydrogenase H-cluster maturation GTPase HydF